MKKNVSLLMIAILLVSIVFATHSFAESKEDDVIIVITTVPNVPLTTKGK